MTGFSGPTKVIDVAAGKELAVLPATKVTTISADANVTFGAANVNRCFRVVPAVGITSATKLAFNAVGNGGGSSCSVGSWAIAAIRRPWSSTSVHPVPDTSTG